MGLGDDWATLGESKETAGERLHHRDVTAAIAITATNADNAEVQIWSIINPPIGTDSIVVTFAGNTDAVCGSSSWTGVSRSTASA